MGDLRDHQPVVIEEFNGLWVNGDTDAVPIDHFSDCENIIFLENGFRTRQGIDPFAANLRSRAFAFSGSITNLQFGQTGK